MPTDPRKTTEIKRPQREAVTDPALRQILALEEIADQLDAIRSDMVGLQTFLGRTLK